MQKDFKQKRYYTIGEVSEIFDISKSLIRFWEAEFDSLKPAKNSKGERRFTPENLEQLQLIYHLVKERGFTLAGAKQEIKIGKERLRQKMQVINRLKEIRSFLQRLEEDT